MKKDYLKPETGVIEIECSGLLCVSTGIDGDADGPALAREREYDEWIDWASPDIVLND